jgi:hypothetical protein
VNSSASLPSIAWPIFLAYFLMLLLIAVLIAGILLGLYLLACSFVETRFPTWTTGRWLPSRWFGRPSRSGPLAKPTAAREPEPARPDGDVHSG